MPPFFIPIISFTLWMLSVLSLLPSLKLDLILSDQVISSLLFISILILVYAWPLSGPLAAAVLTFAAAILSIYLCLSLKEPIFLVQVLIYGALYMAVAYLLYKIQQKLKNKQIYRDKVLEDINLIQESVDKKQALKTALEGKINHFLDLRLFSDELKGIRDADEVSALITRQACKLIEKADECALYLFDEKNKTISLANSSPQPVYADITALDEWVLRRTQAIVIQDTHNDYRFSVELASSKLPFRSYCAIPVITQNRILGVLRASAKKPYMFNPDDLRLLDMFSSLGAVNLWNNLLYGKMNELAAVDGLTGLYVNRVFRDRLEEMIVQNKKFCMVFLDIDYFKRYNDEYGHLSGDMALSAVAAILRESSDGEDVVARYGGEEFAMLLLGLSLEQAMAKAEKLRILIAQKELTMRRERRNVTVSIGVAEFKLGQQNADDLIRAADEQLYRAKNNGRNQVCGNI